jgi:KAP family P-loop domain
MKNGEEKNFSSSLHYYDDTYLRNGITNIKQEGNFKDFRHVIFLDDLDRCTPENTLEVF